MNETPETGKNATDTGSLTDFAVGLGPEKRLDIEVAIKEGGHIVVFHSHAFKSDISWFEFDLDNNKLDFVLEDGNIRDVGLPLSNNVAKHMQNAHQVLMVWMNPETGEANQGHYVPLIIHRK